MKTPVTRHQQPVTQQVHSGISVFPCFSVLAFRSPVCTNPTSGSPLPAPCSLLRKRSAFTLIELLVVIAIIAILAGLGFAGIQGAMESGKKAQARNDVSQLAAAVKAFQLEYGRLPSTTAGSDLPAANNAAIISALTSSNALNPRGIVFFEAKNAKGNPPKGGLDGGVYKDPWGNAYSFSLDTSYDNRITADVGSGSQTHFTSVIVRTTPPGNNQKPISNVQ